MRAVAIARETELCHAALFVALSPQFVLALSHLTEVDLWGQSRWQDEDPLRITVTMGAGMCRLQQPPPRLCILMQRIGGELLTWSQPAVLDLSSCRCCCDTVPLHMVQFRLQTVLNVGI